MVVVWATVLSSVVSNGIPFRDMPGEKKENTTVDYNKYSTQYQPYDVYALT